MGTIETPLHSPNSTWIFTHAAAMQYDSNHPNSRHSHQYERATAAGTYTIDNQSSRNRFSTIHSLQV